MTVVGRQQVGLRPGRFFDYLDYTLGRFLTATSIREQAMAVFVLVHGAWHGGWCWREVIERLEAAGHTAVAVDLPGHGADETPATACSFGAYESAIRDAVRASLSPPVLVGHSAGGLVRQVAQSQPEALRAVAYLSAVLPAAGASMADGVQGLDSDYLNGFVWAPDRSTVTMPVDAARAYLYNACPDAVALEAAGRLVPEPVSPFLVPLDVDIVALRRVPQFYIECLRDRAVPLSVQRATRSGHEIRHVLEIDADHSPFLSAPGELTDRLCEVARTGSDRLRKS
jgi:pimeloyl-ACP methyl ester carboxylesterase